MNSPERKRFVRARDARVEVVFRPARRSESSRVYDPSSTRDPHILVAMSRALATWRGVRAGHRQAGWQWSRGPRRDQRRDPLANAYMARTVLCITGQVATSADRD